MSVTEGHFEAELTMCVRPRCAACEAPNPDGLETCTECGAPSVPSHTITVPAMPRAGLLNLFRKT